MRCGGATRIDPAGGGNSAATSLRALTPTRAIAARLARVVCGADALEPDLLISNDGALEHAAERLTRWLQARAGALAKTPTK